MVFTFLLFLPQKTYNRLNDGAQRGLVLVSGICEYQCTWGGKKIFADVIKLKMLRWGHYSRLSAWALMQSQVSFQEGNRRRFHYTQNKRRRQCDHRGRDRSDVATTKGMLATTRSHKSHGTDPLLKLLEGT